MNFDSHKKQGYLKIISLILLILCAQFTYASHTHDSNEISFEACATCLVAENAELDDVIPESVFILNTSTIFTLYSETINPKASSNRLHVFYLRGPPA